MRLRILAMATTAMAAVAATGTVLAQNVPSQFVITGPAAERVMEFNEINLATAERIANACEAIAAKQAPISVTVWDSAGNEVYMDRMDGQGYINITTAEQKAKTAWSDRADSHNRLNTAEQDPMQNELRSYQLGEFPNSGGLPIVVNKQMIGVVGVGGAAPRPGFSDEICGHTALEQVIGPQPPLVADLPQDQRHPPTPARTKVPVPKFEVTMTPKTTLPPEWVVQGKAANDIFDGYQISLAAAKRVAKACRDFASGRNGTAAIYIIDVEGNLVHAERMDGTRFNNIRMALMKAQTALKSRSPTSARLAGTINNPDTAPRLTTWLNLFTPAGGIPIVIDGQMIGSIGVGGGGGGPNTPNGDEECAIAGLKAVFGNRVALPVYPQQAATGQRAG